MGPIGTLSYVAWVKLGEFPKTSSLWYFYRLDLHSQLGYVFL